MSPAPVINGVLLLVALAGCGTFPKTTVYSRDAAGLPDSLAVLPFTDQATGGRLDKTLTSLQAELVGRLVAKNRFASVSPAASIDSATADAIVQCNITQFDPQVRRVVVVTEVKARADGRTLLRFVTSTKTVSAMWPIDHAWVMGSSGKAAVEDIVEVLTASPK